MAQPGIQCPAEKRRGHRVDEQAGARHHQLGQEDLAAPHRQAVEKGQRAILDFARQQAAAHGEGQQQRQHGALDPARAGEQREAAMPGLQVADAQFEQVQQEQDHQQPGEGPHAGPFLGDQYALHGSSLRTAPRR
jgi:hypothetical protein